MSVTFSLDELGSWSFCVSLLLVLSSNLRGVLGCELLFGVDNRLCMSLFTQLRIKRFPLESRAFEVYCRVRI